MANLRVGFTERALSTSFFMLASVPWGSLTYLGSRG